MESDELGKLAVKAKCDKKTYTLSRQRTDWSSSVGLLEFMSRLEGLPKLRYLELTIPEDLAGLESIQAAFARLLTTLPRLTSLKFELLEPPLNLLPFMARALSNNKVNTLILCGWFLYGGWAPTCGLQHIQTLLESANLLECLELNIDSTTLCHLLQAIQAATKLPSLEFDHVWFATDHAHAHHLWLSNQASFKMSGKTTLRYLKLLDRVDGAFVEALGSFLCKGNIVVETLDLAIMNGIGPICCHRVLEATKSASIFFDHDQNLSNISEVLRDLSSSPLETLQLLDIETNPDDDVKARLVPLMEAIPIVISRCALKHLSCPSYAIMGVKLEGPWEQLHSLRFYGGSSCKEDVADLCSSLLALATASNSLVKLTAHPRLLFPSDDILKIQLALAHNLVGLYELGPAGNVDIEKMLSVLDRANSLNYCATKMYGYFVSRDEEDMRLHRLHSSVLYDVVRLALPPNSEIKNELIKRKRTEDRDPSCGKLAARKLF